MNLEQKTQVISQCDAVENFDITNVVSNFSVRTVGSYDLEIFDSLVRRVTRQLREELTNGFGHFLPHQYNFQNEYGNGTLDADLQNMLSYIQTPNNHYLVEQILNRLIFYQIYCGFWDRGQRRIYSANEVKAREVRDKVLSLENSVSKELRRVTLEKEKLVQFISQKNSELQQIERHVNTSTSNTNEIASLLNISTANNEKINSIQLQQQTKLDEVKQEVLNRQQELGATKNEFDSLTEQIKKQISNFEEKEIAFTNHLKFVEGKKEYFEERNKHLDELIGREVGVSLFETFKQRKNELNSPVNFWKWAVPVMTIATVVWIIFLFNGLSSIQDINQRWEFFAINTLKTLPTVFLLYFVISQYRKERNFQEEYAFKSAVALTIKAYADQLTSVENKDKLILDAVNRIYTTPVPQSNTSAASVAKPEDTKSILEGLKTLKDTVTEVVKSTK